MEEQGLSALVLSQPESITYATGAFAGVASFWRRAGAAFIVVPADLTSPMVAIVGDLQAKSFSSQSGISDVRSHRIWVETDSILQPDFDKPKRSPRPAQFDINQSLAMLRDVFVERGLLKSKIGLELGFVPAADYLAFTKLDVQWQDGTRIVEKLRSIKHPDEIGKLTRAAELAEAGRTKLINSITLGQTSEQMVEVWRNAVLDAAASRKLSPPSSTWAYISVGGDGFAAGGKAKRGDLIKIDVGCVIDGYSSDGARTVSLGKPNGKAVKVYDALHRAFDAGFALLRHGMALNDVYAATATSMWNSGFETYGRGHFGHGVGASIWSEEWPFIAAHESTVIEPNMVLAFETPWYIDGLGGVIIEDQIVITETGLDIIAPSPRDLLVLEV